MTKKLTAAELEKQVMDLINDTIIASPEDAMAVAQLGAAVHIFACSRMRRASPKVDEVHSLLLRGCMWLLDSNLAKEHQSPIANTDSDDELELFVGVLGAAFYDRCNSAEDTDVNEVFAALFATACGTYISLRGEEIGNSVLEDDLLCDRMGDLVQGLGDEIADRLEDALQNGPSDAS